MVSQLVATAVLENIAHQMRRRASTASRDAPVSKVPAIAPCVHRALLLPWLGQSNSLAQYANNAMVDISQLQGSQDASFAHPVVSAESARAIAVSARQELGAKLGPLSFQIPTVHLVNQANTLYLDQALARTVPRGAIVPSCQGSVEFV
jgi:hypothetical protein